MNLKFTARGGFGPSTVCNITTVAGLRNELRVVGRVVDERLTRRFVAIAMFSFAVASLDAFGLLLMVPLVSVLSDPSEPTRLIPVIGDVGAPFLVMMVVTFFLLKTILAAVVRWWSAGAVNSACSVVTTRLFKTYLQAPLAYHDQRNSANLVNTLQSSAPRVFEIGLMAGATAVAEACTLLVLLVVVTVAAPLPAAVGFVYFAGGSLIYLRVVQRRTRSRALESERLSGESIRTIQEGLGGIREHRVRGSEEQLVDRFSLERTSYGAARRYISFANELPRYYLEAMFMGGFGSYR